MLTKMRARPFVKWAGGKQSLAPTIAELFPAAFGRYFEPFLGGGSLFLHVGPGNAVLSDSNRWLIDTFTVVRESPGKLAKALERLVNSAAEFHRIRQLDPYSLPLLERAAHFIYLNKTCFRGLFRVNRAGKFNVPYGNYQRRYFDLGELESAAQLLTRAELFCEDFEVCLRRVQRDDFVYLDPPYYKVGGYSDFNRYTADQFRESDHHRLARTCRELDRAGVAWAVSNSNTPLVRRLFKGYRLRKIPARREINLTAANRDITELLITNY